jgi:hypothetical protein
MRLVPCIFVPAVLLCALSVQAQPRMANAPVPADPPTNSAASNTQVTGSPPTETAKTNLHVPRYEVSVGWSSYNGIGGDVPSAWNVSLARNLTPSVGLVLDIGGGYGREAGPGWSNTTLATTVLTGLRASWREGPPVVPYMQLLVGYFRMDDWWDNSHAVSKRFGFLPAAGVDVGSRRVAFRFELGINRIHSPTGTYGGMRMVVGAVIRSKRTR